MGEDRERCRVLKFQRKSHGFFKTRIIFHGFGLVVLLPIHIPALWRERQKRKGESKQASSDRKGTGFIKQKLWKVSSSQRHGLPKEFIYLIPSQIQIRWLSPKSKCVGGGGG